MSETTRIIYPGKAVGDMICFPVGTEKPGWMICQGQRLRIRDHRKLYRVLRHTYDPGPHYWKVGNRLIRRPHPFRRWFHIPDQRHRFGRLDQEIGWYIRVEGT